MQRNHTNKAQQRDGKNHCDQSKRNLTSSISWTIVLSFSSSSSNSLSCVIEYELNLSEKLDISELFYGSLLGSSLVFTLRDCDSWLSFTYRKLLRDLDWRRGNRPVTSFKFNIYFLFYLAEMYFIHISRKIINIIVVTWIGRNPSTSLVTAIT